MNKITVDGLYKMISRIKNKEQCKVAESFITKQAELGVINNKEWDELMMSVTWLYRDFNRREKHPEYR